MAKFNNYGYNKEVVDLFVTHAWRFHPEWVEVADIIENNFPENVRNFSLPWHDPAISPTSSHGKDFLFNQLVAQISPCSYFILLEALLSTESNLKWINIEVDIALRFHKKIIILGGSEFALKAFPQLGAIKENIENGDFKNWLLRILS